jgi:hypothetical protein
LLVAGLVGALIGVFGPTPAVRAEPVAVVDSVGLPVPDGGRTGVPAFRMVGVSWRGLGEESGGRIRFRTAAGWSAWHELHSDSDEGPDPNSAEGRRGRTVTAPMWTGRADGYQLDLPAVAEGVEVHLVREETRWVRVRPPAAQAATAPPGMGMRPAWGARAPKVAPSFASSLKMGFVHHTVDSNTYAQADVPAMLRAIQAFHMDANGWDDIGYNFLVDRFGGIWEGRAGGIDKAVIGAHAAGFNTGSTGAAVLGDFTSEAPSNESLSAVARLLGWKLPLHGVDPQRTTVMTSGGSNKHPQGTNVTMQTISGHRDAVNTSCPGQRLYDQLGRIRAEASGWAGAATAYPGFGGGVYVAAGRFGEAGTPGFATGAGAGGGPHVRIFNRAGGELGGFFAYQNKFLGGVRVATGNIDGVPGDEIITAPGPGGGPHVRVLRPDGSEVLSFNAYGGFTGGVFVASGNVDGVPGDEIITGADGGAGSHVRVFNGIGMPIGDYLVYGPAFRGGVRVAAADVNGDGVDEIVTGAGPTGGPHVRVLRLDGSEVFGFFAYSPAFSGGVFVGSVPGPTSSDLIVTGPDQGGGPHVRVFSGASVRNEFLTPPTDNTSGIRVSGGPFGGPGQLVLAFGPGGRPIVRLANLAGDQVFY